MTRNIILVITMMPIFLLKIFSQTTARSAELNIDRIFSSSEFAQEGFGPHKWLGAGAFFTTIEINASGQTELILYDSENGERRPLIESKFLRDPKSGSQISIEDYFWSPDEKFVLIFTNSQRVWRTNTRGDYYILDINSKNIRKLGAGLESSSLMFAKFNPTGDQIAYVSNQNIYVEHISSENFKQLTFDGNGDVINGTFDWAYEEEFFCKDGFRWSPDGKSIAFWQVDATNIKDFYIINNTDDVYSELIPIQYPKVGQNPSSAKIGLVEVEDGHTDWIPIPGDPFQHYLPRMQWLAPQNLLLITQLSRKQNQLTLWTFKKENSELKKIYEESSDTWIDVVNIDLSSAWEMHDQPVLDSGNAFVWTSEKDGWRHLYKINSQSGNTTLLTPGEYDIASIKGLNKAKDKLYVVASPANATQRYLYSLNLFQDFAFKRVSPNAAGIHSYNISPSGQYAVHTYQSSTIPSRGDIVQLPEHRSTQTLYDNKHISDMLSGMELPTVEFFQVTTEEGVELDGKMIKPADFDTGKKYPVLFYVYGEPAVQTAVSTFENLWHLMLVQQGYLIITMDNRGTPSLKGANWRKSIYRKIGVVNAKDQALAAKEILKWPFVDTNRIGVWGWSGGGAMTLNLLFKYPEIYKVGIAIAAVTNQLFYDNIYQERYMGLPSENLEDFILGSPASHVAGLEGKLLYIHGTGDDNVHYQNAEFLINALIKENKAFDLMIYPNRSHGIYEGTNTSRHLYETMTNYLKINLMKKE